MMIGRRAMEIGVIVVGRERVVGRPGRRVRSVVVHDDGLGLLGQNAEQLLY